MSRIELRYTAFYVPSVPETVAFYAAAFGLETRYLHPSGGYAELETGATLLSFISRAFLEESRLLGGIEITYPGSDRPPIGAQIAFVTRDLPRDWERALAAGAALLMAPETQPWGQTIGYLRDLNGVVVELCTPSPRE